MIIFSSTITSKSYCIMVEKRLQEFDTSKELGKQEEDKTVCN